MNSDDSIIKINIIIIKLWFSLKMCHFEGYIYLQKFNILYVKNIWTILIINISFNDLIFKNYKKYYWYFL